MSPQEATRPGIRANSSSAVRLCLAMLAPSSWSKSNIEPGLSLGGQVIIARTCASVSISTAYSNSDRLSSFVMVTWPIFELSISDNFLDRATSCATGS